MHVLWPFFAALPVGEHPFSEFRVAFVNKELRRRLARLGVAGALSYRSHDFRRGHARDLQASGASLYEILQARE